MVNVISRYTNQAMSLNRHFFRDNHTLTSMQPCEQIKMLQPSVFGRQYPALYEACISTLKPNDEADKFEQELGELGNRLEELCTRVDALVLKSHEENATAKERLQRRVSLQKSLLFQRHVFIEERKKRTQEIKDRLIG